MESDGTCAANLIAAVDTSGRAVAAPTNSQKVIGVCTEAQGGSVNYQASIRLNGIAQIKSDGSATWDEGDWIFPSGSTAGKGVKKAIADGVNVRNAVGIALNSGAATADLLIDVLLMPHLVNIAT